MTTPDLTKAAELARLIASGYPTPSVFSDRETTLARALLSVLEPTTTDEDALIAAAPRHLWKLFMGYKNTIARLDAQVQSATARAEEAEKRLALLTDPNAVHINILRGTLPLTREQALHIAGATDYDAIKARTA